MSRLILSRFVALGRASTLAHLRNVTPFTTPLSSVRLLASWGPDIKPVDPKEIELRVFKSIAKHDKVDGSQVKIETHLLNDLGLDSLDHVEVIMGIEDEFVIDIDDVDSEKLFTVKDIVDFVVKALDSQPNPRQNPGYKLDPNMQFGEG